MRNYFLGVLFRGEHELTRGSPEHSALQERHLAYNRQRAEEGTYRAFGPVTDQSEILAVAVIDVPTLEEAEALLAGDPAIQARHFRAEAHPLFWPSLDGMKLEY
jgi:hypothetical protein